MLRLSPLPVDNVESQVDAVKRSCSGGGKSGGEILKSLLDLWLEFFFNLSIPYTPNARSEDPPPCCRGGRRVVVERGRLPRWGVDKLNRRPQISECHAVNTT